MSEKVSYLTKKGFTALRSELNELLKVVRPAVVKDVSWAASNGDRSENGDYIYGKKRLRQIDSRVKYLLTVLEDSKIIDPTEQINKAFLLNVFKIFLRKIIALKICLMKFLP